MVPYFLKRIVPTQYLASVVIAIAPLRTWDLVVSLWRDPPRTVDEMDAFLSVDVRSRRGDVPCELEHARYYYRTNAH